MMNVRTRFIIGFSCVLSRALTTVPMVTYKGTSTVGFYQDASFSCALSEAVGVLQVTWKRQFNTSVENLATFSKRFGAKILHQHGGRINFTEASLNSTSIKILNVTLEDEACYICSFSVYPSGSLLKKTCLTVQGIFDAKAEIRSFSSGDNSQEDSVVVSCSGTGKPAPEIRWNASKSLDKFTDLRRDARVLNEEGTVTVTSELMLPRSVFKYVDCLLSCPGTADVIVKRMDVEGTPAEGNTLPSTEVIIAAVIAVVMVAIAVIAVTLKRKKSCGDISCNGTDWMAQR